jgi:hypothetical protein
MVAVTGLHLTGHPSLAAAAMLGVGLEVDEEAAVVAAGCLVAPPPLALTSSIPSTG